MEKIGRTDDGENQIRRGLDHNAKLFRNQLAAIEVEVAAKKFAADIIEKYKYNFDQILKLQNPQAGDYGYLRVPPNRGFFGGEF